MSWFSILLSNPAAILFLIFISLVALVAHVRKFTVATVAQVPTILTMLGILGTFYGVTAGLLNFDVSNIQGSIPALLQGIRTAFIASLSGVFWAITIKVRYRLFGAEQIDSLGDGATLDDVARELIALQAAIVGDEDSTILSQLKLGRQDMNDRLDALKRSQQEFMAQLSEMSSKALISALEEVIRDFNAKINEQFGENFKQLNSAVGKLLEWQEAYRVQLTELIKQQSATAESMKLASDRYTQLVADAAKFSEIASRLESTLGTMQTYQTSISSITTELGQLLQSASRNLPEIQQKLVLLTETVTEGLKFRETQMTRLASEVSTAFKAAADGVRATLTTSIEASSQQLNNKIAEISNKLNEQIVALDHAMETELTKSLESLGRQLTALSNRFVEDYQPLTEQLRKVVRMADGGATQ